jgi:hypothetical protein
MSRRSLSNLGIQLDAVGRWEEARTAWAKAVGLNAGMEQERHRCAGVGLLAATSARPGRPARARPPGRAQRAGSAQRASE